MAYWQALWRGGGPLSLDPLRRLLRKTLPVLVLMKSAPAIIATMLARATSRRVPNSPVARIALRWAGPQAARKALISS